MEQFVNNKLCYRTFSIIDKYPKQTLVVTIVLSILFIALGELFK